MMPTHGYGPFRRFLIGSVTQRSCTMHVAIWRRAMRDWLRLFSRPQICILQDSDKAKVASLPAGPQVAHYSLC
jgi:hypothetical protein